MLRINLLLAYLCLFLVACGTESETISETESEIAFKRSENEVHIAIRAEPPGLNPVLSTQAYSRYVHENIFQSLNDQDPQTFEQVPLLASTSQVEEQADGTVDYIYKLNSTATWPNGTPVTVEDVMFSMKIVLNPLIASGAYRPYYAMVTDIIQDKEDEHVFRVKTDSPYLLAEKAIGSLTIYPRYAYDPDGYMSGTSVAELADDEIVKKMVEENEGLKKFSEKFSDPSYAHEPSKIVGSGPYQVRSWEPEQLISLEKRNDYWASGKQESWLASGPDKLIFHVINDPVTIANAMRDEEVDVVLDIGAEQFVELKEEEYLANRFTFVTVNSFKYFGILLNQNKSTLEDAKVRRALAHTVDVEAIIDQLFDGDMARRVVGPVLPSKNYYNDKLKEVSFDIDQATRLLRDAGWEDTDNDGIVDKLVDGQRVPMKLEFLVFPSPTSESIGALVSEWASEAGIEVEVVRQDFRTLIGRLNKGDFDMAILGQGYDPGPDEFTQVWASGSVPPNGTNRGGFNNPEADEIIKKISVTLKEEDRAPMYKRFQEIIYENQPMVFLLSPKDRIVVSRRFEFEPTSISPNVNLNALRQAKSTTK